MLAFWARSSGVNKVQPPFTAYHNTPNKSVRQNVPRRGVVLHHAAMTSLDGLRYLTMGGKQVSANAICKDLNLESMMPEGFRAWSLSDSYWDSALRSVETANESTNGWTVSDSSHWSLARGVAYWATVDGFWPHRDGNPKDWTVLGHREVYTIHGGSYGTACPGGMDLDLVTKRAQLILLGQQNIEEEVTMFPMIWRNIIFTFGKQYVKHETSYEAAVFIRNVLTGNDTFIVLDDGAMTAVCESFGVPWYAVDQAMKGIAPGQGGKVWSRELEIIGLVSGSNKPVNEQTLRTTLKDVLSTVSVTPKTEAPKTA